MIPTLIVLVGIPGAGKTRWATEYMKYTNNAIHLASDSIRNELLWGAGELEAHSPKNNDKVFNTMLERTKSYLQAKTDVIYDATNLNKKRRIHLLNCLRGIECKKKCVCIITDYDQCVKSNSKRETKVPEAVIRKMYTNFQPPHVTEGWDKLVVVCDYGKGNYNFTDLIDTCSKFDQENPNHDYSLWEHMDRTCDWVYHSYDDSKGSWIDKSALVDAAMFHDIGKLKTKSYDENGVAHYYNHHNVGAYDSILYIKKNINLPSLYVDTDHFALDVANYIYYHMHPYISWNKSENALKRDKKLLGEDMFNNIMLLHKADKNSQKKDKIEYQVTLDGK